MKRPFVLAIAAALFVAPAAHAECKLQQLASIPISFVNGRPMVEATINGKPALLRFSLGPSIWLWGSALKEYDLKQDGPIERGANVGRNFLVSKTVVHELEVGRSIQKDAREYLAVNVQREGEAGLYGNDLLNRKNDIEFDFAHNAVRVFKPDGCERDDVVYWGGAYSVVDEDPDGYLAVKLSGHKVNGTISPGNEVTFVLADEANRSGVPLRRAGSLPKDILEDGGMKSVDLSIGIFSQIAIGDEIIKNAPLPVGNVLSMSHAWNAPDILLGADFLKAHRIYVSAAQRKAYVSYGGGAPFDDVYARLGVPPPMPKP